MRDRQYPLYHEELEHESCGVGAIVDLSGKATHRTVDQALCIVERLAHRAGSDAPGTTGDGVGIMTQLPHTLFSAWAQEEGIFLGKPGEYGVGMFFLPEDEVGISNICRIFDQLAVSEGMTVLGWRDVPCHPAQLGAGARRTMPRIRQCFLKRPVGVAPGAEFDRRLYILQIVVEGAQLAHQHHARVDDGAGGQRADVGVGVLLFKHAAQYVQFSVKVRARRDAGGPF